MIPTRLRPLRHGVLRALLAVTAAAVAALPAVAGDDIGRVAVRRYFLTQADAQCHLLDAGSAAALKAGYVQARNAALRSGYSMDELAPWLAKARDAARAAGCDAPEVQQEAAMARNAFHGFAAMSSLDLPTDRTAWHASRAHARDEAWRLVQYQNSTVADAALGLYGRLDGYRFSVMADFHDGARPYSARLLVRDPSVVRVGLIDPSPYEVARGLPYGLSETGFVSFVASGAGEAELVLKPHVTTNAAGFSLTGEHVGKQEPVTARRFDFPTRAFAAMAQLDPREDVIVAFDCDDGVRYLRFEVGDFITGLTYVGLPSPYGGKI